MAKSDPSPTRKRDASSTRLAILASARRAFAERGYEGAGVRDIAAGAGVTAMLINRYFGSKEGLFSEVLAESIATTSVVMPELLKKPESGKDIARVLLAITRNGALPLEGFQIMLRSAASEKAAQISRAQIEKHQLRTLAQVIGGPSAAQNAAIILSFIAGFQLMRQTVGLTPLTTDEEALIVPLSAIFEVMLNAGPGG
ncbi:TetR/AcrR family transcriptional regulator [Enterobacter sp. Ap-1006]|uniref:TetR/AcrR family transcriptional regulator n=1 Tax=Enterobacter sp. Ap-1006 TaxID=2608345 RepID=UPI00141DF0E1|nr:TetR/AcrR family transcriptional regulator [Enterobacter sp. Ap-1006]NIF46262.1 TetR/AcrR family transcriptional regulator [Enterobacter sp. Ap-1006]